jgi:hypothetical protein
MDRMPNPRRPIIELTPRVQAGAALGILIGSYLLGSILIAPDLPAQKTEFLPNFDTPGVVVIPSRPPTPAVIDLDVVPQPEPQPSEAPNRTAL